MAGLERERLLGPFARREVADRDEDAADRPVGLRLGHHAGLEPARPGVDVIDVLELRGCPGLEDLAQGLLPGVAPLRMPDLTAGPAEDPRPGKSEGRLGRRVDVDVPQLGVEPHHAVGGALEQVRQLLLYLLQGRRALGQQPLSLHPGGVVAGHPPRADDVAVRCAQWQLGRADPGVLAVRPGLPLQDVDQTLSGAQDLLLVREGLPGVLLAEVVRVRPADDLVALAAEPLSLTLADPDETVSPGP